MMVFIRRHGFSVSLVGAVLLGLFAPYRASSAGALHSDILGSAGVFLVLFWQGLSLSTKQLLAGHRPLRLHSFVLGWNFFLFPLLTAAVLWPLSDSIVPELRIGFYLLSIMPTTVASAVSMTSAFKGNRANAIFSSFYSNLFAVFWVPLVSLFYLSLSGTLELGLTAVLYKLSVLILLPLLAGQLVQRLQPRRISGVVKKTGWFCPLIIVCLVYIAFSESLQARTLPASALIITVGLVCVLFFLISWLVLRSVRFLRIEQDQRVAAFFCSSQKSLATGLPLAVTLIGAGGKESEAALLLLPMLVYHPLQLLLVFIFGRALQSGE